MKEIIKALIILTPPLSAIFAFVWWGAGLKLAIISMLFAIIGTALIVWWIEYIVEKI